MYHNQRGFTLPELYVVTSVIVLFAVISIVLIRPKSAALEAYNGQRTTNIAMLAQALQRYKAEKGSYPSDIPATTTAIGSTSGTYPLCRVLVPNFLPDIPTDPEAGSKYRNADREETLDSCDSDGVDYNIGYDIMMKDGAVTLSAPNARSQKIEITIH